MPTNQKGQNQVWDSIHECLHDPEAEGLQIGDIVYDVMKHSNGCRYIMYQGVQFMEQNKNKLLSPYARMAREGAKITWGIQQLEPWIFIKT